jgi:hypothetical protein
MEDTDMTRKQRDLYKSADDLREILWEALAGRKFRLDCGHYYTGAAYLGNDITVKNGAKGFKVICSLCGF